jgi:hypothetical protein
MRLFQQHRIVLNTKTATNASCAALEGVTSICQPGLDRTKRRIGSGTRFLLRTGPLIASCCLGSTICVTETA